jgi:acyl transferase domain-containing protein
MHDWPISGIRRVSINCFGFGGTNAHVIMDNAPDVDYQPFHEFKRKVSSTNCPRWSKVSMSAPNRLFCYSSHERDGLDRVLKSHGVYLNALTKGQDSSVTLPDYAFTLGCRRSEMEWRCAFVANATSDLATQLRQTDITTCNRALKGKSLRICFVFCGQGGIWSRQWKRLLHYRVFRASLQQASQYMKTVLKSSFTLMKELLGQALSMSEPLIAQAATTALQVALVDLLRAFGIHPNYVIGHSSGEICAAYAMGAISRQAAWEVAYSRGLAASELQRRTPGVKGSMIAVGMTTNEARRYIRRVSLSVQIACVNSPMSVTLSGNWEFIHLIALDLSQRNIFHRILNVTVAYHSLHMRLVEQRYCAAIKHLRNRGTPSSVVMFSSVTGRPISSALLDASYWAENMVSPVQYMASLEAMMRLPANERPDMVVELSPAASVRTPTLESLSEMTDEALPQYMSALELCVNGTASVLDLVGKMWCRGHQVDLAGVIQQTEAGKPLRCLTDLPSYPWNHETSYWHESHMSKSIRFREYGRLDLIGAPSANSVSFEPRWRGFLRISESPWIEDHQVQRSTIYPASGMITMVL